MRNELNILYIVIGIIGCFWIHIIIEKSIPTFYKPGRPMTEENKKKQKIMWYKVGAIISTMLIIRMVYRYYVF